jgi:hypothetical protein
VHTVLPAVPALLSFSFHCFVLSCGGATVCACFVKKEGGFKLLLWITVAQIRPSTRFSLFSQFCAVCGSNNKIVLRVAWLCAFCIIHSTSDNFVHHASLQASNLLFAKVPFVIASWTF